MSLSQALNQFAQNLGRYRVRATLTTMDSLQSSKQKGHQTVVQCPTNRLLLSNPIVA